MLAMLLSLLACIVVYLVGSSQAYSYNYCAAPLQLSVTETNLTLKFVQLITRHGDRTATTQLPGNNYVWQCNLTSYIATQTPATPVSRLYRKNYLPGREPQPGNCYAGELTQRGFQQHIELGQNLRTLYVDTYKFLPPVMNSSIMAIRSTDVPRTLASAQGNNLGLYPASTTSSNTVLDIFTMDSEYEDMVPNTDLCPRAGQLINAAVGEPAYQAWAKSQIPLQQKIANIIGVPLASVPAWSDLSDTFEVMACYNQSYPGMDQGTIDQIFANTNWQWNYLLNHTELVNLLIGEFTTELVNNIAAFVDGQPVPKYMVFSGHDSTLSPLLASLQAYDGQWPPYASHAEFELWSTGGGEYYVQVKYQGEPWQLPICSSTMCPLQEFMKLVQPVISIDYQQACKLSD